ncbi:tetratricopeptide repeat protein [Kutzneria sp. NPDC051319]|uniref:tetratricopeptide repeat protein n=1 Tax=Kutzneria sp. NPDC051319 TaxID=3155047 RepID=UPI00343C25E5
MAEQAHSHLALARADDDRPALAHAVRSLELYRDLDEPVWQATALNQIGVLSALTGEYDQARTACEAALVLHRQHGNRDGEANTLDSLGRLSDGDDAVRHFEQALALYRDLGNIHDEADVLGRLAQLRDADGDRVRRELESFGR